MSFEKVDDTDADDADNRACLSCKPHLQTLALEKKTERKKRKNSFPATASQYVSLCLGLYQGYSFPRM